MAERALVELHRTAIGRSAEDRAAEHVVREGFRVLWRNVRIGPLEIDLVAKKDDLVIIAEVRSRGAGAFAGPLASVTWTKRKMLLRAARGLWRGRLKKMPDVQRVRIDVIAITSSPDGPPRIEWIRGAVTEDMR
ncbi:MAG: YraN family protein [Labilithrix sp.]|nr:YraN family protein [Labilithrix sp.]MBX3223204.1 YraN family protein [Labilithrix sp.]